MRADGLLTATARHQVPFTIVYPEDFMESPGPPPGVRIVVHPRVQPGDNVDALVSRVEQLVTAPLIAAKERGGDKKAD